MADWDIPRTIDSSSVTNKQGHYFLKAMSYSEELLKGGVQANIDIVNINFI